LRSCAGLGLLESSAVFCSKHIGESKGLVDVGFLYVLGLVLVVFGVLVIVFAFRRSVSKDSKGSVRGAGVIIVGPVPIVFGTDKKSVRTVLLLSIALTLLFLVTMIVSYLLSR
jgi:uncharacterized protein (TIGR00304 family)